MKILKFSSLTLTFSLLITGFSISTSKAEDLRKQGEYLVQHDLIEQVNSSSSFLIVQNQRRRNGGDERHGGGRGDRHGKNHDFPSLQRQLDELREHRSKVPRAERRRIDKKISNIQENISRQKKGVEHGRRGRGQQNSVPRMPERPMLPPVPRMPERPILPPLPTLADTP